MLKSKWGGWILVSDDKSEAVATIVDLNVGHDTGKEVFKFKGLDDNTLYKVTLRPQNNMREVHEFTAYGDALNSYGVDFGDIVWGEKDGFAFSGVMASRMVYFKKIGKAKKR